MVYREVPTHIITPEDKSKLNDLFLNLSKNESI